MKEYSAFIFVDLSFAIEGTVFFQNAWKQPSDLAPQRTPQTSTRSVWKSQILQGWVLSEEVIY